jgi:cation-transporting ATPase E
MSWINRGAAAPQNEGSIGNAPVMRYEVNPNYGLTEKHVQEYQSAGWGNVEVPSPVRTEKEIVYDNMFTYFNLIFAILSALLCMVGSFRNLTFLPIIIANILIGIFQEIRAKRVLEELTMLNAPHAFVVREGKISRVESKELVLDDIVVFRAGNQICADAVVVSGEIQVNESLLTGESDEITKGEGKQLMSGSFVVSGECRARLTAVGEASYISRLTLETKTMQRGENSEMIRSLDKLVKFVGIILVPIGVLLFIQGFFMNHETLRDSITSMVAATIGMIPEGLYLLASVALVVSAMRLAKKNVLLHDMKSIETLARVDVLCVDKTGTITENKMSVKEMIAAGPLHSPDKESQIEDEGKILKMVGDFVASMSNDNSTMEALKAFFTEKDGKTADFVFPFTSALKYSYAVFERETYVLGAPEVVLREEYEKYEGKVLEYAKKGYRVLVFGESEDRPEDGKLNGKVRPLAYILLTNPIRKKALETFAYFNEQGVEVKVISGDNPLTVSEVAKEVGIRNAELYVDAATLRTREDIEWAVRKYTVFGRVTPVQKREFVHALKRQGRTVAMTGDGVNDVLALKDADCSVAMASGSEAAVQVSQVVLLESDFACMPSVVMEGRRVVNNIQRSASLFLVKNIFSFLLAILAVVFSFTYPLKPAQIALISMFTIGIPAFFLALQPNEERIQGHFISNVLIKALPGGLTDVFAVGAMVLFAHVFGVDPVDTSTAATMLLSIVGFMILYRICQPFNKVRVAVWTGCILGLLGCSIFFPDLFAITGMSEKCAMLFVVFSIATDSVFRFLTATVKLLRKWCGKYLFEVDKEEIKNETEYSISTY